MSAHFATTKGQRFGVEELLEFASLELRDTPRPIHQAGRHSLPWDSIAVRPIPKHSRGGGTALSSVNVFLHVHAR